MKKLIILIIVVLQSFTIFIPNGWSKTGAKTQNLREAQIDSIFTQWDKPETPGCAIAVVQNGKIIYSHGYGIANLDYNISITTSMVFNIGSMSKQFTAACITLLIEKGEISLDDDVREYIPDLPNYGNTITINHLIHHTSGISDIDWMMILAGMPEDNVYNEQDILDLIVRQRELNFVPGTKYAYSNSNYTLLAAIAKRVTGMSLGQYAEEQIFKPLGMKNTFINENPRRIIKNRAIGYASDGNGGYRIEHSFNTTFPGPSDVNTTVEDLFLWDQNFYKNKIGGPNFNTLMQSRGILTNGDSINYAFGLSFGKYKGLNWVGHQGATLGFTAESWRFPEQKFTIICLSNQFGFPTGTVIAKVADLYLADQFQEDENKSESTPTPIERKEISINPEIYNKYVGVYELMPGFLLTVTNENNKLMIQGTGQEKVEVFPESETEFFLKVTDAQVSFPVEEDGKVNKIILHQGGLDIVARNIAIKFPDTNQLSEFEGKYYSDELNVTYTIKSDKGLLFVNGPKAPDFIDLSVPLLTQIEEDAFILYIVKIEFSRDSNGKITGFALYIPNEISKKEFVKI